MRSLAIAAAAAGVSAQAAQRSLQLFNCSTDPKISQNQVWLINDAAQTITLASTGNCAEIMNHGTADESAVWTNTCRSSDPVCNAQGWKLNADGTIGAQGCGTGRVLDVSNYGTTPGSRVWVYHPTGATNQQWKTEPYGAGVRIVNPASGLCLDAGTSVPNTCDAGQPAVGSPLCNVGLPMADRISWLLANLTVQEKIPLFTNGAAGVGRLGIPAYQWWSEALHGVAYSPGVTFGGLLPGSTSFPQICTTGMAFNRTLWHTIGGRVGTEGRAFNNLGQAGLTFWTPNINIARDPRWGRLQETPGEDVFLTSQYAQWLIRGLQEGPDPRYLQVSACAKHYAGYSLESWNGTERYGFNAIISDRDLADTYLPAFASAVTQGRASSLMCSYNAVNGIPSCANSFLLRDLAQKEWGFTNGYITSDCDAVGNVLNPHHYTVNDTQTAQAVLVAGTDIDCGGELTKGLPGAIAEGLVTEAMLDEHLYNLFATQMRLGLFDPTEDQPYKSLGPESVCTADSLALALDGAQQGLTLVKGGALPLSKTGIKTIAVIGPSANRTDVINSNYNSPGCVNQLQPLTTTLAAYASVNFAPGCGISDPSTAGFDAATSAAAAADATVLVMGLDLTQEREGGDRTIVSWPGVQAQLIAAVAAAAKGPVVLVVFAGGSIDISAELANPKVGAIVWAGYPGGSGGQAVARTLFGDSVPAGRLAQTLYPASFADSVSLFDMGMRPGPSAWPPGTNPGRTHRFYTGTPVLPFGYGLSYTTFSYTVVSGPAAVSLRPSREYLAAHPAHGSAYASAEAPTAASWTINVTNTGSVDADDVVLGFLVPPGAGADGVPLQELFGFERVHVPAGATVTVFLGADARQLTHVNAAAVREPLRGTWGVRFGVAAAAKAGAGYAEAAFEATD